MGLYSFLARLFLLTVVLLVSLLGVTVVADLVGASASLLGAGPPPDSSIALLSDDTLVLAVGACVVMFFTIPASLALVGHAGAWFKHIVVRTARYLGVALMCAFGFYLAGNVAVATTFDLGGVGRGVESVIWVAAVALVLTYLVSRTALLKASGRLYDGFAGTGREMRWRAIRREVARATVELRSMPTKQIREKEKPERIRAETIRFQRLIQALSATGERVEFRLSFRGGRGRVLLSVCAPGGPEELQRKVLSVVKAHLPEYGAVACVDEASPEGVGRCIPISGVPEALENPLEPLSRYFLENGLAGDYAVVLEKAPLNLFHRRAARSEQKSAAKKSGGQLTKQVPVSGDQRSAAVRDYAEEMRLEESVKVVERHQSSLVLRGWIWVTSFAESHVDAELFVKGASTVIVGALSGHRSSSALRVGSVREPPTGFRTCGSPTVLLPSEAVPYVWIPQHAMGTAIVPSAEFELPPKLQGEIELGTVVLQSGPTTHDARIPVNGLSKHVFLTGMTGAGKTTSAFNLLIQLNQLGIPFLVIEPVKNEYRGLATTIRSLQVFTLGDEETAPFRLNIFEPPPGVKVQTHVEHLAAVWNSSFVMHAPLCYIVKDVLAQTYQACGWDLAENRRGRPILLSDLRAQSEKVSRLSGYSPDVLMNIEAAFRARITSLSLGGKGPLLDTITSTPIEAILRRPTVIELGNIGDNQEQAFLAALVLTNVLEYVHAKGRSRELKHVTLIEEAHRLLPNISTQKGDPESADPLKAIVEQIGRMLAEVRAYGEGLVIVEQIPTKIIPDAIKNTATKIAHRVPAADDRETLAGAMNLTKEQAAVFTALKPGEAIVSIESHPLPIRIVVPDVVGRLGLGDFSDDEVRRHMNDFYLRNPLPKPPPRLLDELILPTVDTDWFKTRFLEAYRIWQKTGERKPLTDLILGAAKKHSGSKEEDLQIAGKVLSLAVGFYLPFDEKDRATFPRLFMRAVERSMRDDRRG